MQNDFTTKAKRILELAEDSVEGPWWTYKNTGVFSKGHEGVSLEASEDMQLAGDSTLTFIAEVRTLAPQVAERLLLTETLLIEAIEALQKYKTMSSNVQSIDMTAQETLVKIYKALGKEEGNG